jgi:hypothetical protein
LPTPKSRTKANTVRRIFNCFIGSVFRKKS